jgi:hypothetical protein
VNPTKVELGLLSSIFCKSEKRLWIEGFSPQITGSGRTVRSALEDFSGRIHGAYQRLRLMADHQFQKDDLRLYEMLSKYLDLNAFETNTPFTIHRIGRIEEGTFGESRRVRWEDGTRIRVALHQAPPEFAVLTKGTRFSALAQYHSQNKKLISLQHIAELPPIEVTRKDIRRHWNALPRANEPVQVDFWSREEAE